MRKLFDSESNAEHREVVIDEEEDQPSDEIEDHSGCVLLILILIMLIFILMRRERKERDHSSENVFDLLKKSGVSYFHRHSVTTHLNKCNMVH